MAFELRPYRDIITLAAPIAGIQFAQVAITSTSLLMMGFLGVEAVAAGGLALLLYNQFRTMCVGMVTGVGNMIAASVGQGEKRTGKTAIDDIAFDEVRDLLRASMLLATIIAIGAGIMLIVVSHLLGNLGQDTVIVALAQPIMLTLAPALLPMVWLNVLRQFAVGMRHPGSLLLVMITSIIINAFLNAVFIYGRLGMPKLGLTGIGLATTLVQLWTFLVYLRIVKRDEKLNSLLALDGWRAQPATIKKIVRMGMPISLTYGSEAALTSFASVLVGAFGPVALAASNIVNQLAYIVFQLNIGLSHGSSILVSRTAGKDQIEEIGAIARRTFTISFSGMTIISLLYVFVPQSVLRPFLGKAADPALLATATSLLWFAIAHQFFNGSQNICIGLLRGLGNTTAGLTNTLIGYWLAGIPTMLVFGYWAGWGSLGIWFGLCVGFGVTSLLLWWRFIANLQTAKENAASSGQQTISVR
jgi:MATE family multidrug resistance protein